MISALLDVIIELGNNVEKQKMAAIGAMNHLNSIAKERESDQTKLQVFNTSCFYFFSVKSKTCESFIYSKY